MVHGGMLRLQRLACLAALCRGAAAPAAEKIFPDDPNFDFPTFYDRLAELGIVIYPGKLTEADCFRVGSIGRMFERDMIHLTSSVKLALTEQGVALPVTQISA